MNPPIRRLLFVDHSYHARTGSSRFLQELLAQHFATEILWDDGWAGETALSAEALNAREADAIVFHQRLPRPRVLRRLRCDNLIWVPMRDDLRYGSTRLRRLLASNAKVLNFCGETQAFFAGHGMFALGVQYWPEPGAAPSPPVREGPRIFFWPRRQEIDWPLLKALLGPFRPAGILLRYAADPEHELALPSEADIREYRIDIVQGWLDRAEYESLLGGCDIFVAPRPLEGIGLALLEAMSRGLSVIAPDAPTMNEYVEDGVSGWLYSPAAARPLDLSDWRARGIAARQAVVRGHERWQAQRDGIIEFVAAPARPARWSWRLRRLVGL